MKLKATIPMKSFDLLVTVTEDDTNWHDHFGELEPVVSRGVKDMLDELDDDSFYIDSSMDIFVFIGAPYGGENLYLYYGCYLEQLGKLDHREISLQKKHAIIKEQIENFIDYHSKILHGDIMKVFVDIQKRPFVTEVIRGNFFRLTNEVVDIDSIGCVEIEPHVNDYFNVTFWVKEFCPDLTDSQIKEIDFQLRTSEWGE